MIDLHCHSTASDGTDSPAELVTNAFQAGVRTLAITDHDTTEGWDEAAAAVSELPAPFTLIRGAEFSCVHTGSDGHRISLHLLGYLFDPTTAGLRDERSRLRQSRLDRGAAMVAALQSDGYPISWPQITLLPLLGILVAALPAVLTPPPPGAAGTGSPELRHAAAPGPAVVDEHRSTAVTTR